MYLIDNINVDFARRKGAKNKKSFRRKIILGAAGLGALGLAGYILPDYFKMVKDYKKDGY